MTKNSETERYLIPKGTIVHMFGFPVEIEETTTVSTHRANWPLIREAMQFPPEASEPVAG